MSVEREQFEKLADYDPLIPTTHSIPKCVVQNDLPLSSKVPSVNFHFWQPCNMRCGFCFATFEDVKYVMNLPKGHLPEKECLKVVDQIAGFGFEKLNFAGGEPTLCPWLPNLIARAKKHGLVTSIITNGSRINEQWLNDVNGNLDWIGLSIDTVVPKTLKRLGRAIHGKPLTSEEYLRLIGALKRRGIRLKINTVVTALTWQEDLTAFIRLAKPERWKIFQVLPIRGQNDAHIADFLITPAQFQAFILRNRCVETDGVRVIPETNDLMQESYVMIDPAGRFFDNVKGIYHYSPPILEVGIAEAVKQISVDRTRFLQREGMYDW